MAANLQTSTAFPLDPLSADEIAAAVAVIRESGRGGNRVRFVSVSLREASKAEITGFRQGSAIPRRANVILLDSTVGLVIEAILSLDERRIDAWRPVPGARPMFLAEDGVHCEAILRADPEFCAALLKRGVSDPSLIMAEAWSAAGHWPDHDDRRLAHALVWLRAEADDNGFARPVEGLTALIDLDAGVIAVIEDTGVIPLPPEPGNYAAKFLTKFRQDIKPVVITQPDGASFAVDGQRVSWQRWSFRIGWTAREGLVLHTVGYEDGGRIRPILHRAALSEMVVPYGDPTPGHNRKAAFDAGEYGVGALANSLTFGCDCLGEIRYFDAVMANESGDPVTLRNAICLHEEDYGILWKHTDWRTGQVEVRRSRRLVVSFITTVGNYEYGFFWYFYQDGSLQYEVKLTGIVATGALTPGESNPYGTEVAPQLYAPSHQHFFNVRMDMCVDGEQNSVYEVNTESLPKSAENPLGNAFAPTSTLLATELMAQRTVNPNSARFWKIVNPNRKNRMGQPVAYKLEPGANVLPFAQPDSPYRVRAPFLAHHLHVTPFNDREMYAAGDYPNQRSTGDGLPVWMEADRNLENTDIVVWYTFGHHHIPRLEDWPIMPCAYIGFHLKPSGFFDRNPALDVPPAMAGQAGHVGGECCSSGT